MRQPSIPPTFCPTFGTTAGRLQRRPRGRKCHLREPPCFYLRQVLADQWIINSDWMNRNCRADPRGTSQTIAFSEQKGTEISLQDYMAPALLLRGTHPNGASERGLVQRTRKSVERTHFGKKTDSDFKSVSGIGKFHWFNNGDAFPATILPLPPLALFATAVFLSSH